METLGLRPSFKPLGRKTKQRDDAWFKKKQKERNHIEGVRTRERTLRAGPGEIQRGRTIGSVGALGVDGDESDDGEEESVRNAEPGAEGESK